MKLLASAEEVIFGVEKRFVKGGGASLHLMVRLPPQVTRFETRCFQQIWRADCFRAHPHEHVFARSGEWIRNVELDPTNGIVSPLAWCEQRLKNIGQVACEAGYPELLDVLTQSVAPEVINTLMQWMHEASQ